MHSHNKFNNIKLSIKTRSPKFPMNLLITKSEELDFPNFETCLYTNGKARIAEFNRFGSLLAIGCKYGITLIMDFTTKEIIRIFDYHGPNNSFDFNNDLSNFVQFSNSDYSQIFDLFEAVDQQQAAKKIPKIPSPKSKDRIEPQISNIDWSYDSNYILVSYQQVNQIILWDIEKCEKVYILPIEEKSFLRAQLYQFNPNISIISCAHPYIVDMKTKEKVYFLTAPSKLRKYEEEKMQLEDFSKKSEHEKNDEDFLSLGLSKHNEHYFLIVAPNNQLILLKEKSAKMADIHEENKTELSLQSIVNTEKFDIISTLSLNVNGKINGIACDEKQKYIILNATDRCLRLIKISYKKRELIIKKEIIDVINRKKWMTIGFFTIGHPQKEPYIVSGVGESGSHEICFMHLEKESGEKKLGPSKEGCLHLCGHYIYHNSIIVVTSNGDLLLWSVKNPKCWTALAPNFIEIEENIEYIEKEEEFDVPNTMYVAPVTDPKENIPIDKKSDYFDVKLDLPNYLMYSQFHIFSKPAELYQPRRNLPTVKPNIKPDFLTMKGKNDIKKLKEKMESRGIIMPKRTDEGIIEINH